MSARDVIAEGLAAKRYETPWRELRPFTRAALRTFGLTVERILTAAGYRILDPKDFETINLTQDDLDTIEIILGNHDNLNDLSRGDVLELVRVYRAMLRCR